MSKDGVVPPLGGPSRRPAGGPANLSGADKPAGGPGAHRRPEPARDDGWDGGFATAGDLKWSASEAPDAASASAAASIAAQNLAAALRLTAASGASGGVEDLEPERGPLSPAEANLANALRSSVARVGASGPPAGSLPRIQRRARTRQRNRTALAGSAGVLVLAIAVTMATGDRFDIVPTLTSAVGLGGSSSGGAPQADGSSEPSVATNGVHTVWPTGSAGKEGLAIGPVAPVMATPSAAAATKVPLCTTSSLNISTTIGTTEGGVVYGSVDAVAQEPCVVVGPPVLTVANQAGTAAQSVKILREDRTAAPMLPAVTSWGTTMVLKTGDAFQFQFAWDATDCGTSIATSGASPTSVAAARQYYLGYAATGTTPTSVIMLAANCGANVYVTDLYAAGTFPLPKTLATQPPPIVVSSTTPAPPASTATSEPPPPPPSSPSAVNSPSAPPDSPSPSPSGVSGTTNAPGAGLASGNATSPTG